MRIVSFLQNGSMTRHFPNKLPDYNPHAPLHNNKQALSHHLERALHQITLPETEHGKPSVYIGTFVRRSPAMGGVLQFATFSLAPLYRHSWHFVCPHPCPLRPIHPSLLHIHLRPGSPRCGPLPRFAQPPPRPSLRRAVEPHVWRSRQ